MIFSQRLGKTPIKVSIQTDSMDNELRISLWNVFHIFIIEDVKNRYLQNTEYKILISLIWMNFFKRPLDTLSDYTNTIIEEIREWFFSCDWYEVYDFLEFIISVNSPLNKQSFIITSNNVLEKEVSGYRFISEKISPITDKNEISGIENAIRETDYNSIKGAHIHLTTALNMLTDRKNPDYRNSIKESISAVESLSQIICGDPKAELGKALKLIEDSVRIHPALKSGFSKIYGYTSDENGIRHAILDEEKIGFEDAKYMLVSCSAFVSYLITKASRAGIKL